MAQTTHVRPVTNSVDNTDRTVSHPGSGSLNLPSDVVEELDAAGQRGSIAIIIEDREVRLVSLMDVLLPNRQ